MSTHKHFDKICCVVLALTLIVTVLFVNADKFGIQKALTEMGYETAIFDNSKVHTINIVMDNWDEFLENCRSEEYYTCSVVIDNEAFKNVAIRGKGNTSLSSVESYGNNRYSFKIEFDHYDSTNTYHGLDKLVLNNIIQDNTYMKDYLTYQMMNEMGVAAPLCSFVYITVNGEDWGLYLAVEGVEESFLQRNYGNDYGELYKPDSMNMGGGRGNGKDFDMDSFLENDESNQNDSGAQQDNTEPDTNTEEPSTEAPDDGAPETPQTPEEPSLPADGENPFGGQMPGGMTPPDFGGENPFGGQMPGGMSPPDFGGGNTFGGQMSANATPLVGNMSKTNSAKLENTASRGGMFGGMTPPDFSGELPEGITLPTDENGNFQTPENFEDMGGKGGMSSSDVKLQYIDDNIESYANIFDSAKTDINETDQTRLIESLKKLSNGEQLESAVDIEAVIRYFVVHNFVVNSDSYTGSMIHNYYLYEKDGQMQMIPWDYNLAFGSFMSMGSATSSVNDPIDTPLSVNGSGDRPMIDWIFSNEEYTELYHQYFSEFISKYFESGYFESFIDSTVAMISPFVEKDPTKFCTYEEFEAGSATLKEFCLLRAQSVRGQLDGTIGTTTATQASETLIDASDIDISVMGTMGNMGGKGGMSFPGDMQKPQSNSDEDATSEKPSENSDNAENNGSSNSIPQMPEDFAGEMPSDFNGENPFGQKGQMQRPDGNFPQNEEVPQNMISPSSLISIGACAAVLLFGLIFALLFKRRK